MLSLTIQYVLSQSNTFVCKEKTYLLFFFHYVAYVKLGEAASNQLLVVMERLEGELQPDEAHVTLRY